MRVFAQVFWREVGGADANGCLLFFRQLLDEQLGEALEGTSLDVFGRGNVVLEAMLALLTREGFAG
jgi:hypothetical protein